MTLVVSPPRSQTLYDTCSVSSQVHPFFHTAPGLSITTPSVQCCFTSTETIRFIRDGEEGGRYVRGWGRGRCYTYRYTVTTRMTCIKMGSDESHFNVSFIVRNKFTKTESTDHNF